MEMDTVGEIVHVAKEPQVPAVELLDCWDSRSTEEFSGQAEEEV
jgi:hypothetical protein